MTCLLITERPEEVSVRLTPEAVQFMKTMQRSPSVLRCGIALALLRDEDMGGAEKLQTQFETVARTYPYPAEIDAEREILAVIKNKQSEKADIQT